MKESTMSRRDFIKLAGLTGGAAALAACAPKLAETATPVAPTQVPVASATPVPAAATAVPAPTEIPFKLGVTPGSPTQPRGWKVQFPNLPSGLPINPPLKITSSHNEAKTYMKGDTSNNSPFTRMAAAYLGIEWASAWNWADNTDRDQKYTLAMSSGELPDFLETIPLPVYSQMLEAGLLEDITDAFEKYASDRVKADFSLYNGMAWSFAEVNKRKMGLPYVEVAAQNDKVLWIRQDWLDKVGMKMPATLDEVEAVAKEFVKAGLGQGAKGTTVGLLACNQLTNWYASLDPVLGAFGVCTSSQGNITEMWVENNGQLVYSPTQPGMKEALTMLARWYKDGVIPVDFDIKQPWEQEGLIEGNQCGMHFSPFFAAGYGAQGSLKNDPNARWTFGEIPTGPNGKRGQRWSSPYNTYVFGFRKGIEPAKVLAALNQLNWMADLYQEPERRFVPGWEEYNYTWEGDKVKMTEATAPHAWFFGPVGTSGNSGTDPMRDAKRYELVEKWAKLPASQQDAYQQLILDDPSGIQAMQRQAYLSAVKNADKYGIVNRFMALPTTTMAEKGADLYSMETQYINDIIKGAKTPDAWDEFVTTWKSQGGDQITAEVNKWWSNKK